MTTAPQITAHTTEQPKDTARRLRAALKAAHPHTKFSVRTDGNAIRVNYTDGPRRADIDAIAQQFRCGRFNGMDDSYDFNGRELIPNGDGTYTSHLQGAMYVFVDRSYSADAQRRAEQALEAATGEPYDPTNMHAAIVRSDGEPRVTVSTGAHPEYASRLAYQLLYALDLTA